jgi:leucine dehydrogenase
MSLFAHPEFDHHEAVHHFEDRATGLQAIIALHSTALGPAAGGCRRWSYVSDDAALTDALRLSRGMTYKNAIAGLPFGGGKAVILADQERPATPALFAAFGRAVDSLNGRYITAEDVGVSVDDMRIVHDETRFVAGLPKSGDSAGGDPSPYTALGVFLGLKAAVETRLGMSFSGKEPSEAAPLAGLRVAVQGVGHVGHHLCLRLVEAGATVLVADVNQQNLERIQQIAEVEVVAPEAILSSDVDVLAPCALGGILSQETIPGLRAKVIAGAANNQLATDEDGVRLTERNILYAPDYVINAGGIINVAHEYQGDASDEQVRFEITRIPERLREIFASAARSGRPTHQIADELARSLVDRAQAPRALSLA